MANPKPPNLLDNINNLNIGELASRFVYEYTGNARIEIKNEISTINVTVSKISNEQKMQGVFSMNSGSGGLCYCLSFLKKQWFGTKKQESWWETQGYILELEKTSIQGDLVKYSRYPDMTSGLFTNFYPSPAIIKEIRQMLIDEILKYEEVPF